MFKKCIFIILAAGLVTSSAFSATTSRSSQPGWWPKFFHSFHKTYVGGFAGLAFLSDRYATVTTSNSADRFRIGNSLGYNFGVITGYRFNKKYRMDLTLSYLTANIHDFIIGSKDVEQIGGYTDLYPIMLNGYYDFGPILNKWKKLTPYLGVGLGAVYIRENAVMEKGSAEAVKGKKFDSAVQAIAGLSWKYNPRLKIFLDYHYLMTSKVTMRASNNISLKGDFESNYRTQLINLGVIYRL